MKLIKEKANDYFLLDTNVENMFINEYMVAAPGDYVKVYLFALMYANLGVQLSNEDIAKQLSMDVEDVLKAWTYWDKMGVIRKIGISKENSLEYDVEFVMLKEMLYGNHGEASTSWSEQYAGSFMERDEYRQMYSRIEKATGRVLSGTELYEIASWVNDFGTDTDVIGFAFEYCAARKKTTIKYVETVIKSWIEEGCRTIEEVRERIDRIEGRNSEYKRIFKALGFQRNPTEEEKRLIDSWLDKMGFEMSQILKACSKTAGISSPNMNYVNRVLENWYKENGGAPGTPKDGSMPTTSEIMNYYEALREQENLEAEIKRREVYHKVPRIKEIDDQEAELGSRLSRIVVSNQIDKKESAEQIRETIDTLNLERAVLLTDNGFDLDYMDVKFSCERCKDTGMLETGEKCQCFGEITKEKINLLKKQIKK